MQQNPGPIAPTLRGRHVQLEPLQSTHAEGLRRATADGELWRRWYTNVPKPEAVGDYVAGPNHVLPTSRTARFASGLSVFDFLKRTTWVEADAAALARIGPAATALAEAEGLDAHARSIALRLSA